MPDRLLFLTGAFDVGALIGFLGARHPGIRIEALTSLSELDQALALPVGQTRLVSFCTSVIVPRAVLDALNGPAYNLHPGPPSYPGRYPECWGAYHGVPRFGATLHVMAPRVDEGPIVDTLWFDVPAGAGQMALGQLAFEATLTLLLRWADRLLTDPAPLPLGLENWSGRKWRLADFESICRLPPDIGAAEFERRRRAFAEVPGSHLTVDLHGVRFDHIVPVPHAAG